MINIIIAPFYSIPVMAQEKFNYVLPEYDGNTIQENVIYKINIPTTEEEIEEARKYDAEQARLAALKLRYAAYKTTGNACNCILYAQEIGLDVSGYGAAKNYPVNSQIPAATGFVVTYESFLGHAAKYTLQGENLVLQEANYYRCQITSTRILSIYSPLIKGYWN